MDKISLEKDSENPGKLSNVFGFIDDLIAINDGGIFESNFGDIYPKE